MGVAERKDALDHDTKWTFTYANGMEEVFYGSDLEENHWSKLKHFFGHIRIETLKQIEGVNDDQDAQKMFKNVQKAWNTPSTLLSQSLRDNMQLREEDATVAWYINDLQGGYVNGVDSSERE